MPGPPFSEELPQPLLERITTDQRQLTVAGYAPRVVWQPDGVVLTCSLPPVDDYCYKVIWFCSRRYPLEPPRLTVVEEHRILPDNHLSIAPLELLQWREDTTLLTVLREIQRRIEGREREHRIDPADGHPTQQQPPDNSTQSPLALPGGEADPPVALPRHSLLVMTLLLCGVVVVVLVVWGFVKNLP